MLTPDERAEMRRRCDAASAGPWMCYVTSERLDGPDGETICYPECVSDEDGAFIAAARTDLPAALADLDAKDAEIARLSRLLAELGVDPATGQIVNLSGLNEVAAWATVTAESPARGAVTGNPMSAYTPETPEADAGIFQFVSGL